MGGDRYDEVWDGVYVMSPLADLEHQKLGFHLASAIEQAIGGEARGSVLPGANVSDRVEGWVKNYRCPDVVAYLLGNPAQSCGSHWCGGPDFAVEILSRGDRSRKKFAFYASVGVRELLLVNRHPWRLELYRLVEGKLEPIGMSMAAESSLLASVVLPLTFRLLPADPRPQVEVAQTEGPRRWLM